MLYVQLLTMGQYCVALNTLIWCTTIQNATMCIIVDTANEYYWCIDNSIKLYTYVSLILCNALRILKWHFWWVKTLCTTVIFGFILQKIISLLSVSFWSSYISWYPNTFYMMHQYTCTLYCPISNSYTYIITTIGKLKKWNFGVKDDS